MKIKLFASIFSRHAALVLGSCLFFLASSLFFTAQGQKNDPYTQFIHNNIRINWAAEYESVVNLTPVKNTFSLKDHLLDKIRNEGVRSFQVKDRKLIGTSLFRNSKMHEQDWLSGHYVMPSDRGDRWEFRNRKAPDGYRVNGYSTDSCCGCDDANAFRVNQLMIYAEGKLTFRNIFYSPLCARKVGEGRAAWYPAANIGWNVSSVRPASAAYLTTSSVTYNINPFDTSALDIITVGDSRLASHFLNDIRSGLITAHDPETGKRITASELETWKMPVDTVATYDDEGNISGYQVVSGVLQPSELIGIRVTQNWYFDKADQKLYSEVADAVLLFAFRSDSGEVRGRLEYVSLRFRK